MTSASRPSGSSGELRGALVYHESVMLPGTLVYEENA